MSDGSGVIEALNHLSVGAGCATLGGMIGAMRSLLEAPVPLLVDLVRTAHSPIAV